MTDSPDFNNNSDSMSQEEIDIIVETFRNSFKAGNADSAHIVLSYPADKEEFAVFISGNVGKLIALVQDALDQDDDLRQIFMTAMLRQSTERVHKLQALILEDNDTNNQTIN